MLYITSTFLGPEKYNAATTERTTFYFHNFAITQILRCNFLALPGPLLEKAHLILSQVSQAHVSKKSGGMINS